MNNDPLPENSDAHQRLEEACRSEKPRLLARLRAVGRSLEEAEDLVHDVYAETIERLPLVPGIHNLSAWINSLFTRRMIDAWRHERVRAASGEIDVAEDTLREIIGFAILGIALLALCTILFKNFGSGNSGRRNDRKRRRHPRGYIEADQPLAEENPAGLPGTS